jgi:hypothetical protein
MEETKVLSRRNFILTGTIAGLGAASLGVLGACANQTETADEPKAVEGDANTNPVVAESTTDTLFVVDELHCKPGDAEAVYKQYMESYAPGAEARGMTLVSATVCPPIWLTDEVSSNELTFTWSIAGMMGWAGMVTVARYDPEVAPALISFWQDIDKRVVSRTRTLSGPESDVESLTTLAKLGA